MNDTAIYSLVEEFSKISQQDSKIRKAGRRARVISELYGKPVAYGALGGLAAKGIGLGAGAQGLAAAGGTLAGILEKSRQYEP